MFISRKCRGMPFKSSVHPNVTQINREHGNPRHNGTIPKGTITGLYSAKFREKIPPKLVFSNRIINNNFRKFPNFFNNFYQISKLSKRTVAIMASEVEKAQTILNEIQEQGNNVRTLKQNKADAANIKEAIEKLLSLKADYKSLTGQEVPRPETESKKKNKPDQTANETPNLKKQEDKQKKKAEKLAKRAAHKNKKGENAENENKIGAEQNKQLEGTNNDTEKDVSEGLYGIMPMIRSKVKIDRNLLKVRNLSEENVGTEVWVRGRVHKIRTQGVNLCFLTLRDQQFTIQSVCASNKTTISKQMVRYVGRINPECVIDLRVNVVKAPKPIEGCTKQNIELNIVEAWVVSEAAPVLPLQIEDAQRPESEIISQGLATVTQDTRLNNRILDIRTTTSQAIFRVQAGITRSFREILTNDGFIELQFPKIIPSISEGAGANVFSLSYFKKTGYLAQSPQLYKQMAIAGDFDRVFTVGPVFRAEDSNTHRHLCEFVGLDIEMAFNYHYHEVVEKIGSTFTSIFKYLRDNYDTETKTIFRQYPNSDFEFCEPALILNFPEAVKMLNEAGIEQGETDDLSTPTEKALGKLVKQKYHTDFYILDKFPLSIRPFYTMPDPTDDKWSNSYDMFMRGEEILSGAQRIHDPVYLAERITKFGARPEDFEDYIESFKYGCPPHAGGGIGLERVTMLYLGLSNIRFCSLFPRDPKRMAP